MMKKSLTGVWHGLYTYPHPDWEPVYFVATLIAPGTCLEGTTHEAAIGHNGAPLKEFAGISGSHAGTFVTFDKTYDGAGSWMHTVSYAGTLNADFSEIEGVWMIPGAWSGRFLMLRAPGVSEAVVRRKFERV